MITYFKITALLFVMLATGCESTKSTSAESVSNEKTSAEMTEKIVNDGYSEGTIKFSNKSECPVLIIKEDTKEQFDPINIDNDKFMSMKNDGNKVYFKFRRLRMMNRCDDASPIELEDMKPRG